MPDLGYSPGRTLLARAVLSAVDEGLAEFDLLRGDEPYKDVFATGTRYDVRLRALRPTARTAGWVSRKLLRRAVSRSRCLPALMAAVVPRRRRRA